MEKVLLRRVPEYNPKIIQNIITEGMDELGTEKTARQNITIKPNVVLAHHKVAPSAYTRSEFLDGLIHSLRFFFGQNSKITISEKTGAGLPTSRMFRRAGYAHLKSLNRIKLVPLEEDKKIRIPLSQGTVHKSIRTGTSITDNDFLVYAPKLKSNVLSHGLTAALKLNIGILLDRERMWNHNFKLDQKIADLLEVGLPDLIVTDAVEAAIGGNQMTQHGVHLGLVILARNPVAHDAVCAHILNLDPKKIPYLNIAHKRGYGPMDIGEISIGGDVSLFEIQKRTKTWDLGLKKVDQVDAGIKILCGLPYCSGGCHGVFLDWLYMIKDRKPKLWRTLPQWTVVLGKYKGDVTANRLMKIGTCTEIQGKVKARKQVKIKGCPPKHKSLVLFWLLRGRVINPLFRLDLIIDSYFFLFLSWCRRLISGRL